MNAATSSAGKNSQARDRTGAGFGRFRRFGGFTRFIYLLPFDRGQIPTAKPNDQPPALPGRPHPRIKVLLQLNENEGHSGREVTLVIT
jgi:hypothetical protein